MSEIIAGQVVEATNDLTARWVDARSEAPSVISGIGVWPLLHILANGAAGDTRHQLVEALGLQPSRNELGRLLETVQGIDAMTWATGTWAGPHITLDPEWIDGLPPGTFDALTGDTGADQEKLNAWVRENTRGKITEMPLELDDDIQLVLASALALATDWENSFTEAPGTFNPPMANGKPCQGLTLTTTADQVRVGEDLMRLTCRGKDDIDVVLTLGTPDLAPQFVLSQSIRLTGVAGWGTSGETLEIGDEGPGYAMTAAKTYAPDDPVEVDVNTVAFDLKADLDLLEDADILGLRLASDSRHADFSRLCAAPGCYVGQAKQRSTATFSAHGFEAASVTAVGMILRAAFTPRHSVPSKRLQVAFDRPFAYTVVHRPSGLVLLAGWVKEALPLRTSDH